MNAGIAESVQINVLIPFVFSSCSSQPSTKPTTRPVTTEFDPPRAEGASWAQADLSADKAAGITIPTKFSFTIHCSKCDGGFKPSSATIVLKQQIYIDLKAVGHPRSKWVKVYGHEQRHVQASIDEMNRLAEELSRLLSQEKPFTTEVDCQLEAKNLEIQMLQRYLDFEKGNAAHDTSFPGVPANKPMNPIGEPPKTPVTAPYPPPTSTGP